MGKLKQVQFNKSDKSKKKTHLKFFVREIKHNFVRNLYMFFLWGRLLINLLSTINMLSIKYLIDQKE